MLYTIEKTKETVHRAEIEGNTLREALQKIEDGAVDWGVPDSTDDEGPDAIVSVSLEGNTYEQNDKLLKDAKVLWKEIAS